MRWVDQAITRPHRCAVIPYVTAGPLIDTGQDLDLEHVYISLPAAEHIAQVMLGWTPPQMLARAREETEVLQARVAELEAQLVEAEQFADAIDGLTRKGMVIRKQPGRKAAKKKEEELV